MRVRREITPRLMCKAEAIRYSGGKGVFDELLDMGLRSARKLERATYYDREDIDRLIDQIKASQR